MPYSTVCEYMVLPSLQYFCCLDQAIRVLLRLCDQMTFYSQPIYFRSMPECHTEGIVKVCLIRRKVAGYLNNVSESLFHIPRNY